MCRSLRGISINGDEGIYSILRRYVASIAARLAFYRLIEDCKVAHRKVLIKPFTDPDSPDISIAGQRIEFVNFLISNTRYTERITRIPESILHMPMIVNLSGADHKLFQDEDILLFSIALGKTTAHLSELKHVKPDGNKFLLYRFPVQWAYPDHRRSLGRLIMKSEYGPEMSVEIGGSDEHHFYCTCTQTLPVQLRIEIEREFFSLTYVHVAELPAGRISIFSPALRQTCTIHSYEWGNLWVYGSKIMLVGYITWQEFTHRAYEMPAGTLVFGEMRLPMKCKAIEAINLYPIRELIPNIPDSFLNKR